MMHPALLPYLRCGLRSAFCNPKLLLCMKRHLTFVSGIALAALLPSSALAVTATSLSSFNGIEEPQRIYHPGSGTFTTDSFVNITDVTSGTIQTLLRYSSSQWDGDRTTSNTDRGRAEVKNLGPNQKINETFDYTTTWRTNTGFKGSGGFCHITQLKGTNGTEGSSGAPLVVTSINSGTSSAVVRYASTSFSPHNVFTTRTARNITWSPNTWLALKIRIRTTADGATGGQVTASVNGDALQGVTNVEVSRPEATNYYPKWGIYRKHETSSGFSANDYIQHSNVSANIVTATPTVSNPVFSPGGGTYSSAQSVTISTSTSGATIRYTTDGSNPSTTAGTIYSGAISVPTTRTLKAIAYMSGSTNSAVVTANYTITSTPPPTVTMEAESLSRTTSGPTVTTGNDSSASGGVITYFNATGTAQWVEFTTTSLQAGTYQIKFRYKRNTARGQHTLTVDGTQVGGTIDEYGTNGYVEVTVGNVTFASAGTHTIRLTVTGRNASSTSFVLAPDRFIFTGQ
jgi:hypothetical protein